MARNSLSRFQTTGVSYIDYNLYWYAKSFEIGNNQGVYWDNFFICPSFNTEMTDAYRRPDGSSVPAAGSLGGSTLGVARTGFGVVEVA